MKQFIAYVVARASAEATLLVWLLISGKVDDRKGRILFTPVTTAACAVGLPATSLA